MAVERCTVDFGEGFGGIATVGYAVRAGGSVIVARTVAGVEDLGNGVYAADVTVPDGTAGTIYWDTAPGSPVHAADTIDTRPRAGTVTPAAQDTLVEAVRVAVIPTAADLNRVADHVVRRSLVSAFASTAGDAVTLNSLYGSVRYMTHAIQDPDGGRIVIYNPDGSVLGELNLDVDPDALPVVGVHT